MKGSRHRITDYVSSGAPGDALTATQVLCDVDKGYANGEVLPRGWYPMWCCAHVYVHVYDGNRPGLRSEAQVSRLPSPMIRADQADRAGQSETNSHLLGNNSKQNQQ